MVKVRVYTTQLRAHWTIRDDAGEKIESQIEAQIESITQVWQICLTLSIDYVWYYDIIILSSIKLAFKDCEIYIILIMRVGNY